MNGQSSLDIGQATLPSDTGSVFRHVRRNVRSLNRMPNIFHSWREKETISRGLDFKTNERYFGHR